MFLLISGNAPGQRTGVLQARCSHLRHHHLSGYRSSGATFLIRCTAWLLMPLGLSPSALTWFTEACCPSSALPRPPLSLPPHATWANLKNAGSQRCSALFPTQTSVLPGCPQRAWHPPLHSSPTSSGASVEFFLILSANW